MVFSLFNKNKKPDPRPENPADRELWLRENSRAVATKVIPDLVAKNELEYVAWNCDLGCRDTLARALVLSRGKQNPEQARGELLACGPFLNHLESVAAKAIQIGKTQKNWIHVANVQHALLACCLAGDWTRAGRLSDFVQDPVFINSDDPGPMSYFDAIVRMVAACVRDDAEEFGRCQRAYHAAVDAEESRFFKVYFTYDRLMQLILARDGDLDKALANHELLFLQRATDKKTSHEGSVIDAMLEENTRSFDVWSTALAHLAIHRGLTIRYATPIIPTTSFAADIGGLGVTH